MIHLKKCIMVTSLILVVWMFIIPTKAYIQRDGTITEATIMRQIANDSSKKIAKLKRGQIVKVNNEVVNDSGEVWYQIYVKDGVMGYVLANKIDVEVIEQTVQSEKETQVITITERIGTVTAQTAIRVREKSSTGSEQIASMVSGDTFLVLEDETAADGYVWYKIEYDDHSTLVQGYVRSDLVSVEEVVREEYREVKSEIEESKKDVFVENEDAPYSIISQKSVTGKEEWYLVDKENGDTTEIEFLLAGGIAALREKIDVSIYKCLIIVALCIAIRFYIKWKEAIKETKG